MKCKTPNCPKGVQSGFQKCYRCRRGQTKHLTTSDVMIIANDENLAEEIKKAIQPLLDDLYLRIEKKIDRTDEIPSPFEPPEQKLGSLWKCPICNQEVSLDPSGMISSHSPSFDGISCEGEGLRPLKKSADEFQKMFDNDDNCSCP